MLAVSADGSKLLPNKIPYCKTVPKEQSVSRCKTKDWMKINV